LATASEVIYVWEKSQWAVGARMEGGAVPYSFLYAFSIRVRKAPNLF
jgi:hypothetical protein